MKEKTGVLTAGVCAMALSVVALNGFAEEAAQAVAPADGAAEAPQAPQKIFEPLVRITSIRGAVEVKNPDVGTFAAAVINKTYPLGSIFRTAADATAVLLLSRQETVTLSAATEVEVRAPKKNNDARVVRLIAGTIETNVRDNPPEGAFNVITPNAVLKNIAGKGKYTIFTDPNGESFQIATITGSAIVIGPQYEIPALRAANTLEVLTAQDRSMSRLTSISGDFGVKLANGDKDPVAYTLSPKAVIKIWRENAPVGGRQVVSVLAVSHTGTAEHRYAYVVGRPNLATGEQVKQIEKTDEGTTEDDAKLKSLLPAKDGEKPAVAKPAGETKKPAVEEKPAAEEKPADEKAAPAETEKKSE
jgi:hypothetical protein